MTILDSIAYIGTWGADLHGGDGEKSAEGGIKTFRASAGQFEQIATISPDVNAGIICVSSDKKYLYATDERKDWGGIQGNGGGVCAYKIENDGTLTFLNEVSSAGAYPCYIAIDAANKFVFICNHGNHEDVVTRAVKMESGGYRAERVFDEGSVAMFPVLADGKLGECCDVKVLQGSSVIEWYQWTAHPHSVKVDPSNKFLVSPDKGSDRIRVYRIDYVHGKLEEVHSEKAEPGSGPRHVAFHPSLPLMYVNGEQNSTVHSYRFDEETGALRPIDRAKTIPPDYAPANPNDHFAKNETADIRVHKSGKFLYVSNRGHNSIAPYMLDDAGNMTPLEFTPSGGEVPRAIQFNASGDLLYALNQRSGNVVEFSVDDENGALLATGYEIRLSNPVCMECR